MQVENEFDYRVKIIRLDNDIEFINDKFRKLFEGLEVILKFIIIYISKINKLSEIQNRIVINDIRAILFNL